MFSSKKVVTYLVVLFSFSALTGCQAFKTQKCDRCPEFTKTEKADNNTVAIKEAE